MKKPQTGAEFIEILDKELLAFGVADRSEILADFRSHFIDSAASGMSEAEICEKLGNIPEIAKQYADDYISPAISADTDIIMEKKTEIAKVDVPVLTLDESPLQLDTFAEIEEIIAASPVHPDANSEMTEPETIVELPAETIAEEEKQQQYKENAKENKNSNTGAKTTFKVDGLIKVLIIDLLLLSWVVPTVFSIVFAFITVPISLAVSGLTSILGGFIHIPFFHSPFSSLSNIFLGFALLALGGLTALLVIKFGSLFIKMIRGIINWHSVSITGHPFFKKGEKRT